MFETPVLFIIFNRPETTLLVFEQIKKVKPKYLFVAADGPRKNKPGEEDLCSAAREIIMNDIDWDCEIKTLFRNENAGCKKGPITAINWFFEHVEQGIILEDDCLPHESFFYFCKQMLYEYKDDGNILTINGCNFNYKFKGKESYFFSRYTNPWGWATWKTSVFNIDYDLKTWPKKFKLYFLWTRLRNGFFDLDLDWYRYWRNNLDEVYDGALTETVWDYQMGYYIWCSGKKVIVPSKNLVINIGFNSSATHTFLETHSAALLELEEMKFPIKEPTSKKINTDYEEEAVKPVWHLHKRKDNLFYFLNYINTRPLVQFFKTTLKPNR